MKTILKDAESKMQKALDRLDYEYSTIRAGRANPAVLEKVSVDYYGAMTPINQMAAVSVAEARKPCYICVYNSRGSHRIRSKYVSVA